MSSDQAPAEERATQLERGADAGSVAPRPGTPTDHDTTSSVLDAMADEGMRASFIPRGEPGSLRCTVCDSESPAGRFEVVAERRLEGASDPDDMVMVVGLRCPVCHIAGTVVLGYGPDASESDADVVAALAPAPREAQT